MLLDRCRVRFAMKSLLVRWTPPLSFLLTRLCCRQWSSGTTKGHSRADVWILAERRPSHGIDHEQDAAEAVDTVPDSLARSVQSTSTPSQSTDSNTSRPPRPARASRALSQLPRLNSMRAIPGAGAASASQTTRKWRKSYAKRFRRTQRRGARAERG